MVGGNALHGVTRLGTRVVRLWGFLLAKLWTSDTDVGKWESLFNCRVVQLKEFLRKINMSVVHQMDEWKDFRQKNFRRQREIRSRIEAVAKTEDSDSKDKTNCQNLVQIRWGKYTNLSFYPQPRDVGFS